ncbi:hypothetical protein HMPREF1545_00365 [Oscillibacter sp. KLE 1728]|nr:hypothetical protein HMPREF1545_00365 [Oscillibacter sp. KLE 1728]ERK67156.1 hypothetical protein HMPREF1546_00663 [Oscillibacter sp. KLE 1745]
MQPFLLFNLISRGLPRRSQENIAQKPGQLCWQAAPASEFFIWETKNL